MALLQRGSEEERWSWVFLSYFYSYLFHLQSIFVSSSIYICLVCKLYFHPLQNRNKFFHFSIFRCLICMTLIRKVSLGEWRYLTSLLSVFACAPLVFVIVVCTFLLLFVHAIFSSSFSFYISCLEILSECQTNHCLHCHHHHDYRYIFIIIVMIMVVMIIITMIIITIITLIVRLKRWQWQWTS